MRTSIWCKNKYEVIISLAKCISLRTELIIMNFVYWILFYQIKLGPRLNLIQFDKIEFSTFLPPENGPGLDFPHGRTKRPKIYNFKENPCKENKRCWIVSLSCLYTDLFNQKLLKYVLFYSLLYKIENKLVFSEKTS